MAKGQSTTGGFKKVSRELNLWKPTKKGESITLLVTAVGEHKFQPDKPAVLQVKGMEPDGSIITLPGHAVLCGMLADVPGGCVPYKTVLRVTYQGTEKGKQPQPMQVYDLEYRDRTSDDLWSVPMPAATPAS